MSSRTISIWACCVLAPAYVVAAQETPSYPSRDVVILALGSGEGSGGDTLVRQARRLLAGGNGNTLDTLRDVQMAIVRATAPFGPVLLLAPDEKVSSEITERCHAYDLCDFIAKGVVRLAIVPHDTAWIRDYGPVIEAGSRSTARVIDAVYDNARRTIDLSVALRSVNDERMLLIKIANRIEATAESRQTLADIQAQLQLLAHYAEILRDESAFRDRPQDDDAAFDIAQAVLVNSARSSADLVQSQKIFLDGGNLLKTDDGACLTTTELYSVNRLTETELAAKLSTAYGCRDTIYLEPLPGRDVIRHVDMFVLPALGKRLLLADFGLDQAHIKAAWPSMSALERELTFQAAVAMTRNEKILRARGYDVLLVPAPVPRGMDESRAYYPTVMNALVRSNGRGRRQVILPSYDGFQADVQKKARDVITDAFGAGAEIVTVESTVAAQGQGAVHCLTITAPFDISIFSDGTETFHRQMWALRESLNESLVQVTRPVLIGRWSSAPSMASDRDPDGWKVTFGEEEVTMTAAGESTTATYVAVKEHRYRWPLELTFDHGTRKVRGRIEWLTDSSMRLMLEKSDTILLTRDLTLEELQTNARSLPANAIVNGLIGDLDERLDDQLIQAWEFVGRAGDVVTIDAASDEFDTELLVVGPGLDEPLYNDDLSDDTRNSQLVVTIPETATYKVVVRSFERDEAGAFTLSARSGDRSIEASLASLPSEGRTLRIGTAVTGQLTRAVVRDDLGPVQAWTLSACQAPRVRIDLASEEFDTVLFVSGPGIDEQLSNDDSGGTLDSSLEFDCREGASYSIIVGTADDAQTGTFRLSASTERNGAAR